MSVITHTRALLTNVGISYSEAVSSRLARIHGHEETRTRSRLETYMDSQTTRTIGKLRETAVNDYIE